MLTFDSKSAQVYASLRANERVKPLDAMHLATAARWGADYFITNDERLQKLAVEGIGKIVAMDAALLA